MPSKAQQRFNIAVIVARLIMKIPGIWVMILAAMNRSICLYRFPRIRRAYTFGSNLFMMRVRSSISLRVNNYAHTVYLGLCDPIQPGSAAKKNLQMGKRISPHQFL